MGFAKGNQLWKLAGDRLGRPRKYETSADLWNACLDYFQWVEDNPLWEAKLVSFQGESTIEKIPKMRAMTLGGLTVHLGICDDTWRNWRSPEHDFFGITREVDEIIREQKFSGAAAELLNPNIIARDLGLTDKTSTEHTGGVTIEEVRFDKGPSSA